MNSYKNLPVPGAVTVFPLVPDTLSACNTAAGVVKVCEVEAYVTSKIILPKVDDAGKFDRELEKGIYTGHFTWQPQPQNVFEKKEKHAKVFEFNPKVLDGGKNKKK